MTESQLQQQIVQGFKILSHRYNFVFFAPMNEGTNMAMRMFGIQKLKQIKMFKWLEKMGFLPGVSDIIIFHNEKAYCMELKTLTGTLSKNQKEFRDNVLKTRVDFVVVRSYDQAIECLKMWGIMK